MGICKFTKTLVIIIGLTLVSGAAWADPIAGSTRVQTLHVESMIELASGLDDSDVCATLVNYSEKSATLVVTIVSEENGTPSMMVAKNKSAALCDAHTNSVEVACMGPGKCAFTWSLARF